MFWQQLWFLSNMVFVTLAIVFLFMHRSVTAARQEADAPLVAKRKKTRLAFGLLASARSSSWLRSS